MAGSNLDLATVLDPYFVFIFLSVITYVANDLYIFFHLENGGSSLNYCLVKLVRCIF